jgi:hypothetical protein
MTFESELITPEPVPSIRRVVIELPEERALALSRALNEHVEWHTTEAEKELIELHEALGEDWRTAEEFEAGEEL